MGKGLDFFRAQLPTSRTAGPIRRFTSLNTPGLGVANSTNASEIGLASVTASAGGDASYDSIIALGAGQNKVLHANHDDVLPKPSRVSVFPANSRIISHLITHGGCVMCDRRSLSDRPRSTPLLSLRGPRRRCLGVWKKSLGSVR